MIAQPAPFSKEDLDAIRAVSGGPLTTGAWADTRVADLKARAKKHYIKEQKNRCCYCAEQWLTENGRVWDLEHIVPKAVHPHFMFESRNLAVACPDCNIAKLNADTLTDPTVTDYPTFPASYVIVHPHFDRWEDHLKKNVLVYSPISEKGTWTVKHCKLGRFAMKYIDPRDETDPYDRRFESAIDALTGNHVTAQAAIGRIQAYLAAVAGTALP